MEKRKDIVPKKITPKTERIVQQVAFPAENIGFMMGGLVVCVVVEVEEKEEEGEERE